MPLGSISGSVVYRPHQTQNYSSGRKTSGGFAHAESGRARIDSHATQTAARSEPKTHRPDRPNADALNHLIRQFVGGASGSVTREGIGLRGKQAIQAYQQNAAGEDKQKIRDMLGVDERA